MIKVNTRPVRICIPALVMGLIIGLTSVELNAEILLRHTIEDYQGTLEELGWLTNSVDEGEVERFRESDDPLQTQAHGAKSLRIYGPDASSYAHAVKTFALPAGEEYMIEFYLWIPGGQVRVAGLNICKLFTAGGTPQDIRALLISGYMGDLVGCLIIEEICGQVPIAWSVIAGKRGRVLRFKIQQNLMENLSKVSS